MKSAFYDTTFLVKLYCRENGSLEVMRHSTTLDSIFTGFHARAEMAATLHRKRREGALDEIQTNEIQAQFLDDLSSGFICLCPVGHDLMAKVEGVLGIAPSSVWLRAADALHLASAEIQGFAEIFSNDRHLLAAAPLFGLTGVNVIP